MAKPIVLDVETQLTFRDIGKYEPKSLKISVVGVYDYASDKFLAYTESQLAQVFPYIENASKIIGFNINHFDLPVIEPYYLGDMDKFLTLDLLEHIERSLGFRVSLDVLASETLGLKKSGHGLLAIEYYKNGEIDKLKKYCLQDVRLTRDLYEYGKSYGKVFFKDVNVRREIPVKWANDTDNVRTQVNLTMPW